MIDLTELAAKQEIFEVLATYCRGVDRLDENLVRGIYHEDAYDDHGYWKGRGLDFARFVVNRLREANLATTHALHNVLIEIRGELAFSEAQVQVTLVRRPDPDAPVGSAVTADVMAGRYVDRFSRRGGVWKIDERYVVLDWTKVEIWPKQNAAVPLNDFLWGQRNGDDAIQQMLACQSLRPGISVGKTREN